LTSIPDRYMNSLALLFIRQAIVSLLTNGLVETRLWKAQENVIMGEMSFYSEQMH